MLGARSTVDEVAISDIDDINDLWMTGEAIDVENSDFLMKNGIEWVVEGAR